MSKFFQIFFIFLTFFSVIFCARKNDTDIEYSNFNTKKYTLLKKETKIKYLDSVLNHFHTTHNDSLDKLRYFDLSNEYYSLNEYIKSIQASKKALLLSKLTNDTPSIAKAFSYIGDCYLLDNKDSSYYFYHQAEKLYRKLKIKEKLALMLFKKALLLTYEGNYSESEIQVSRSLQLLKETKDYQLLFSAYTILGSDFEKLEEYDSALKYYISAKDVLKILRKNEIDFDSRLNYNLTVSINLSNTYQKLGNYKKGISELSSLITIETKEKWPKEYAVILSNVGNAKLELGNLKEAKALLFKALKISKQYNFEDNIIYECINLGEYFYKINDFSKSTYYLKEALHLAQKIKATDEIKTALRLLVKVDFPNSHSYDERYIAISDSLVKTQRKSREKYARIEYETSVVEDENKMLSIKNTYILIVSILSIVILVTILFYRNIKSQKRELLYRINQQKAEEEIFELLKEYQIKLSQAKELEQNRISKELHDSVMNKLYGARMQLGILNEYNEEEIKEKRLVYVDLLQEIEQEIRTISHDLHTEINETQFDYSNLLSNLIHLQNEIGATNFSLEIEPEINWDSIDSLIKITVFRIVQESVLNISKHANASTCSITILLDDDHLVLEIRDDGIGFDLNVTKQGIGLQNIQERAKTINANLEIISEPNEGTTIKLKAKIGSL